MPMKRLLFAVALCGGVSLAAGPARAQDDITFFNRKTQKEERVKATVVEEGPGKVTYQVGSGPPQEVPAGDVVDIDYQAPRGVNPLDYRTPATRERRALQEKGARRKELLHEALAAYRELYPRLPEGARFQRRQVRFKTAQVLALLAEDDPAGLDAAIDALKQFQADHGDGWQLVPAVKLLARLQEQKGDAAAALATYEKAADNGALPGPVHEEFGLLAVRYLLRRGKHEDAARRARALKSALAADDPQALKLQVYLAACDTAAGRLDGVEKQLKAVLESGADNDVKALACNTLGDYYRARGRAPDAFWQYLVVDVLFNQDREELAKALYYLSKLYVEVRKDTLRARECLDRLGNEKDFGGLEYYRRAAAEKAGSGG
jgi:hypothetical protein